MKVKYIILFLFLISLTSGLQLGNSSYIVNKTLNINQTITLNIINDESLKLYNITCEPNNFITFNKINELGSGSSVEVQATIFGDENYDDIIRIKGYYVNNVGELNEKHDVQITQFESNPCSFSVYKGDSVTWHNNLLSIVNLKKYPSLEPVPGGDISANSNFTLEMNEVKTQGYKLFLGGWDFGQVCEISTLDTTGFINNPEYDALLNLKLNLNYESTSLYPTLLNPYFNMFFYEEKEGVLSIKNNGDEKAYDISLSGGWFDFEQNNFDLAPGETKGVIFNVFSIINSTEDTNKTYIKEIKINGNFEEITLPVEVFIKHSIIDENYTSSQQGLIEFIKEYCEKNPDVCGTSKVIYSPGDTQRTEDFEITEEQWRDYWLSQYSEQEEITTAMAYVKEVTSKWEEQKTMTESKLVNIYNQIMSDAEQSEQDKKIIVGVITMIVMIVVGIILYYLVLYYKNKNNLEVRW